MESGGGGKAARAFHELRVDAVSELRDELPDIMVEDGREIGVGERRVAAADQLDQRADIVAGRDLGEAEVGGDGGEALFVVGVAVAVHQHDRHRPDARIIGRRQRAGRTFNVQRAQHFAIAAHPLVDLNHTLI